MKIMHIGQSYFPAPSGELEMTSNRKLQVGPSQRKSTNSRSSAWAHLYKLPHVVGGPIFDKLHLWDGER